MLRLALLVLATAQISALRVLVTGAGGRTGSLVFQQLSTDSSVEARGLVRSKKALKKLRKIGASDEQIVRGDATSPESLAAAMAGCGTVILCTSAVPQVMAARMHLSASMCAARAFWSVAASSAPCGVNPSSENVRDFHKSVERRNWESAHLSIIFDLKRCFQSIWCRR